MVEGKMYLRGVVSGKRHPVRVDQMPKKRALGVSLCAKDVYGLQEWENLIHLTTIK